MPTEFYYPDAANATPRTYDEWTLGAGGNKGSAVLPGGGRAGPMTHDDDSTYLVKTGTDNGEQEISLDEPVGPIGTITALTLGFRHRWNGASNNSARGLQFINSAGVLGGEVVGVQDSVATYATLGPSNAFSLRPGGGSWVASDFTAAAPDDVRVYVSQIGADAPDGTLVTSIWGEMTYETPSGGFAFLLQLAGAAALPFVGRMDFGQFTRYLSWRQRYHPRHTIMTGDEVVRAWDEIRAYRHPRFFFPAVV